MKDIILVTGATGFIGKNLLESLLPKAEKIYVLVRMNSLSKVQYLTSPKIEIISGDIEQNFVLDNIDDLKKISQTTKVVHAAAKYDLNITKEDAYIANVIGTKNVLMLASQLPFLTHFFYVSSYVVNTKSNKKFNDDDLDSYDNNNEKKDYYAWSKNLSEHLVRDFSTNAKFDTVIFRPGIVIGSTKSITNVKADGPYFYLQLLLKIRKYLNYVKPLKIIPFNYSAKSPLPFIAVDYLVYWMSEIIANPKKRKLSSYHLFGNNSITADEFMKLCNNKLNLPLKITRFEWARQFYQWCYNLLEIPPSLLNYTSLYTTYQSKNLNNDYPTLENYDFRNKCDIFFEQAKKMVNA